MEDLIAVEVREHIADVRLNRPTKMNSLTSKMFQEIDSAIKSITENKSVRAVVLSGQGKGFCAGLDITTLSSNPEFMQPLFRGTDCFPNIYQSPCYQWKALPVPVICAIHGVAFGGGLQMALAADIRVAKPNSKLSLREIQWGLIPDMSASQTIRDLVRIDVAKELALSGRIVSGTEAESLGLVTRLADDPLATAFELAREIVKKNPDATTSIKRLFNEGWHGNQNDGLKLEEDLQKKLLMSENQIEAVNAHMENREPAYANRTID